MNRACYSLLVVEDDDLDIEKLKRSYRRINVEIELLCATDGEQALHMLRDQIDKHALGRPPIMLLDINLPRLNGLELLQRIRADKKTALTPVFIISTSSRPEDVYEAYRHNAAGYFTKPMTMSETYELVRVLHQYWSHTLLPAPIGIETGRFQKATNQ
ncbi:MAG: response regulator [Pseudomonadota bacterium]